MPRPAHPVLMLLGVGAIAAAVTTSATFVHLDSTLGGLARAAGSEASYELGFLVSTLGGTDLALPLTAAAAALLCTLRQWAGAATLVLAVLATQGVVDVIKGLVERPRPDSNAALADASGFSFPSAHSATSMALYATLAFLLARRCRGRLRTAAVAAGAALVVAIGLSRVFLAAHYPADVLAGWLTGAALVAASWLLVRRFAGPRERLQPAAA